MYLFLSSGANELYRQDILRAIATPVGSVLQFRYAEQYVAQAVRDLANKDLEQFKGRASLIVYLDRGEPADVAAAGHPEIVPCRFAEIREVRRIGTNFVIRLQMKEFAHTHSVTGFNNEIRTEIARSKGQVPSGQWVGKEWKVDVDFWGLVKDNLQSVKRSTELVAFEQTVKQLVLREMPAGVQPSPRADFKDEPYFFTFQGLRALDTKNLVTPNAAGLYSVTPGKEYELHIVHFYPSRPFPNNDAVLEVSASREIIEFTSSKRFRLQSAYDEKVARFLVEYPAETTRCVLTVTGSHMNQKSEGGMEEIKTDWFDLEVEVPRSKMYTAFVGAVIATPLATGPIMAALLNPQLKPAQQLGVAVATLVGAWFTGAVAALNLKKPL